jgi:hypothetical protein
MRPAHESRTQQGARPRQSPQWPTCWLCFCALQPYRPPSKAQSPYLSRTNHQADLSFADRQKWVNAQSNAEAKRELKHIGSMFKKDPLSPLSAYSRRYVITGFGLFTEGYAWVYFLLCISFDTIRVDEEGRGRGRDVGMWGCGRRGQ